MLSPPHLIAGNRGLTLVELVLAIALIGVLAAIALPMYQDYKYRVEVAQAIKEIGSMSLRIKQYALDARVYPPDLATVGLADAVDPWGSPYQYLNLSEKGARGKARKDRHLNPLNSDFDLYSIGKDKDTVAPLVPKASHDDVIRANDGSFIGLAKDF